MPTKYCVSSKCGSRIDFTGLTPPSKCSQCGTSFAVAFKLPAAPAPSLTTASPTQTFTFEQVQAMLAQQAQGTPAARGKVKRRSADTYAPGRGSNHANSTSVDSDLGNEVIADVDNGQEGSDVFDSYEVQANAKLLTQGISAVDFQIGVETNKVKFEDAVRIVNDLVPAPAAKKPRRRKG